MILNYDVITVRRKHKFGNKTVGLKFQDPGWVWRHLDEAASHSHKGELGQRITVVQECWLMWVLRSRVIEQVAFPCAMDASKIHLHLVPIPAACWL